MKSERKTSKLRNPSRLKGLVLGATAVSLAFIASADEPDARGKQLFLNCVACHGADAAGNKLLNAPALAGLSEKQIVEQLTKFKNGMRGGDVRDTTGLQMRPMAQVLQSDADMAAVAAHISSLDSKKHESTLEGDAARGKNLYMTCQACHGADAKGNDLLKAPALAGQHDWYLAAQLHKFKEGIRGGNPADIAGSQMRPMSMMLADDQAIADVIAYIETLSE